MEMGVAMYQSSFLSFVRYCYFDNNHFFKGLVHAQMYKKVMYNVRVKISVDNEISGSHCGCAAGAGGQAHCKHVIMILLDVLNMVEEGRYITRDACAQKLQTFHHPKKTYQGTPLKARRMERKNVPIVFDPRPAKFRNLDTKNRLHNLCVPLGSNMPYKHLLPPANRYATDLDHTYSSTPSHHSLLKQLCLVDVSKEDIEKVERETRGQARNPLWNELRSCHMTASNFQTYCTDGDAARKKAIARKALNAEKFYSDPTNHGILYEGKAVDQHMYQFQGHLKAEECGLFLTENRPYLGTSPDRLKAKVTLLKVKCPYAARERVITPITVPYLYPNENGQLCLRTNHKYMYQVQGHLAVTGRKYCDLIIWTFKDMKVISIERDEAFISNMLVKLDFFYT